MRLVTFSHHHHRRVGVLAEDRSGIYDLKAVWPDMPSCMRNFVAKESLLHAKELMDARTEKNIPKLPMDEVEMCVLLPNPGKIVGALWNHPELCNQAKVNPRNVPTLFSWTDCTVFGNGNPIETTSDVELNNHIELGCVIGEPIACRIEKEDVTKHVAGYTITNYVSSMGCVKKGMEMAIMSKDKQVKGVMGMFSELVTTDELLSVSNLSMKCSVNSRVEQESSTSEMIFGIEALIAYISKICALDTGDIVLLGTPAGVGCFRKPPRTLEDEDNVECEIEGIGKLTNEISVLDQKRVKRPK